MIRKKAVVIASVLLITAALSGCTGKNSESFHLQSGIPLYDSIYSLAKQTVGSNIKEFEGKRILKAGEEYGFWTRDTAYNALLGTCFLYPRVMRNSLEFCVGVGGHTKEGREHMLTYESRMPPANMEEFIIGGQYWDAISWVVGAWEYYLYTGDEDFLRYAYNVTRASLEWFESEEFDEKYGLFMGPVSYGDGVASYPEKYEIGAKGSSFILDYLKRPDGTYGKCGMKALSTNCLYYWAYMIATEMSRILEEPQSVVNTFERKGKELRDAINRNFWLDREGRYRYFIDENGNLDDHMEGLGESLAILTGVADREHAEQIYRNQHITEHGIPCLWPVYSRFEPEFGRHSGTVWPFIQGFWAWATYKYKNMSLFANELRALTELVSHGNEFREIYHPITGEPYGGMQCGVLWNSTHNQTWSAAAYLSMVHHNLFGMNLRQDGIEFDPLVPSGFSEKPVRLLNMEYRNASLNITIHGSGSTVERFVLDGKEQPRAFFPADLSGNHTIDMYIRP
jgi:hypothetical protein